MNEGESCIMFGHAELKLIYHFPEVTLQMLIVGLGGGEVCLSFLKVGR